MRTTLVKQIREHSFSIEMRSKDALTTIFLMEKENSSFFLEGFLGKLKNISLVEDVMLEIEGKHGIIKLDLTSQEIKNCFCANKKKIGSETE